MFARVDPLTLEHLEHKDEKEHSALVKVTGGLPPSYLPPASQKLGSQHDWWECKEEGSVPWATVLDLEHLPCGVDDEALLLQRQLQLQQHHAETAALAALAGDRLCQLGNNNPGLIVSAASAAMSAAHNQLQQQLQNTMAADAAVLAKRYIPPPTPAVLAVLAAMPLPQTGDDPETQAPEGRNLSLKALDTSH